MSAQALVDLLQTLGHLLKAFTQPRFQGGLQFFVDGLAHLVELGRRWLVVIRLQPLVQGVARPRPCAAGVALAQRLAVGCSWCRASAPAAR
jgi:hypothetical protein